MPREKRSILLCQGLTRYLPGGREVYRVTGKGLGGEVEGHLGAWLGLWVFVIWHLGQFRLL